MANPPENGADNSGTLIRKVEAWAIGSSIADMDVGGGVPVTVVMHSVVVRVTTDDGAYGVGDSWVQETDARILLAGIRYGLAPLLLGDDSRTVNRLWEKMWRVARNHGLHPALSAIDIALWDLLGRRTGLSVSQLLGGPLRPEVEVYSTLPWRKPKEELAEMIRAAQKRGFRGAKVAVGHGVDDDRETIAYLCSAVPGMQIAVDANGRYDSADAIRVGSTCDEYGVRWFEEPVPYTDIHGLATVRSAIRTPVSGFQFDTSIYSMRKHLQVDALTVYQPSLDKCGGITQAHKMATLADAWGRRLVPHSFAPALSFAASLHIAGIAPTGGLTEFPVPEKAPSDFGRFVFGEHLVDLAPFAVDEHSHVRVPTGPGLGVDIDFDKVRDLEVATD